MKGRGPLAWLVYLAVRVLIVTMQMFPIEWNLTTARIFARIWMALLPRHRDRAIQNLAASYGRTHTPDEIRAIAAESLVSSVMFAVEVMCLPRLINRFTWSRYIRLVNFKELVRLILEGRGLIMVTAHYGSFELIGHLIACFGFRIAAVMRPLDNDYLNRFLVSTRRTHGLGLFDKKGATSGAERYLNDGGLLCFIGDQDAGRKGVFVDFFGRPASAYKSIGLLAMQTRRPIVVGFARRRGGHAQYDIGVQRIIMPEEWEAQPDPLQWVTQAYTSALEDLVRVAPEQYLWAHRRWKSQPRKRQDRPEPAKRIAEPAGPFPSRATPSRGAS